MLQVFDERNRDLIVNVAGRLTHRDQAGVSPFDSAVQGGDAVWEGLRLHDGKIFRLDEHLARLRASARALAFARIPSDDEITEQIRRTLAANGMRDGVHVRLTLTRGVKVTSGMDPRLNQAGPTLIVLAEFKDPVYEATGITLITASVRRPAPDCLDPKIHHNNLLPSILAKIEANVAGADDAVVLDHRGFIAETNATHLFMVTGGRLATPTTASCPEGITRAAVLELAASAGIGCETGDYTLPQLYTAEEVFVTGTMGGLAPVLSVEKRRAEEAQPNRRFDSAVFLRLRRPQQDEKIVARRVEYGAVLRVRDLDDDAVERIGGVALRELDVPIEVAGLLGRALLDLPRAHPARSRTPRAGTRSCGRSPDATSRW